MTSRSTISREGKPSIPFSPTVKVMIVIEDHQWVEAWFLGEWTLLPVHPPEIDTFIFQRMME